MIEFIHFPLVIVDIISKDREVNEQLKNAFKAIILLISFFKSMKLLRFSEQYGFLIKMILQVFADIYSFLNFFVAITLLIYVLLVNQGAFIPMDDYRQFSEEQALVFQTFRNSIGDISLYDHDINPWNTLMITGITLLQIVLNIIVFLNFLIAEISQTYEKITSSKDTTMYQLKTQMNLDTQKLLRGVRKIEAFKSLIITTPRKEETITDEFTGIVDTILKGFRKQQDKYIDKANRLREQDKKGTE